MCELCVSSVICVSYEVDVKMKSLSEVDSPLVVNAQGALPIDLILRVFGGNIFVTTLLYGTN